MPVFGELVERVEIVSRAGGPAGATSHAALSGLGADDHAQYHTNARGDARYSLAAHDHAGTYQPLATVLTNTTAAFTTAQETKLSGIAAGAQVNVATDLSYTAATRVLASSTGADATFPLFGSADAGLTPASGGGTTNFLRADGTWAAPGGGSATDLTYTAATRVLASSTGTDATLPLVTSGDAGLAPASGGGTSNFLRADGTWAAPAGGPGGEAFPVGSVFIAVVSTNPGTLLGYGTWSAFGAGRVLVGLDSGDTDFDTVEETGGAKTVASSGTNAAEAAHTHTYTEVPNHVHVLNGYPTATGGSSGFTRDTSMSGTVTDTGLSTNNPTGGVATGTTAAGSSHTHTFTGSATSVVQPYITVYMWKRTA